MCVDRFVLCVCRQVCVVCVCVDRFLLCLCRQVCVVCVDRFVWAV